MKFLRPLFHVIKITTATDQINWSNHRRYIISLNYHLHMVLWDCASTHYFGHCLQNTRKICGIFAWYLIRLKKCDENSIFSHLFSRSCKKHAKYRHFLRLILTSCQIQAKCVTQKASFYIILLTGINPSIYVAYLTPLSG